jgi:glucan 1,3-beta-glucosidase
MGNPLNPPKIKASASFTGDFLIYGKDPNLGSTINFYIAIKNLVLDSTNIAASTTFTLLDWSVSQATQLTNLVFNMPDDSTGHTGISMPEGGSGTMMGDLTFHGGDVGINMSNQQYNLKNITFIGSTTGILVSGCFQCTFQSLSFQYNNVGIQYTNGGLGALLVIDSTATDIGTFVAATAESTGANSLVIENFVDGGGVTNVSTYNPTSQNYSNTDIDGHSQRNNNPYRKRARDLGLRQCLCPRRPHHRFSPNGNYISFWPSIYSPQLGRKISNDPSANIRHLRCD